ncbi:helix-turn-helix domain-containing protein [Methanolobus sediminis]|uniref:Helix-turn-helix domain-containing protein n=1 Tax=Methanolobus sediminis TaxID=3072978 RepID=A0AA51UJB2_9EURY|nr:helix-turn-helix domain-containing protein [Methanolobus sediminis]WMW24592.1 helix-turn-helix domain-containing protein [Methanolobus sediminis]
MIFTSLQNLGFTSYEAKVYVALVRNENATVSTLHDDSGVPNSAIYGALKKLEKRGIIEFQNTKPMRYRCIPPEDAMAKLKNDYSEECDIAFEKLNDIYGESTTETTEELIWNINGVRNVTSKVIQMMEAAKKDILILASSTPFRTIAENHASLKKDYTTIIGVMNRKAGEEGISVRVISSCEDEAKKIKNLVPLATVRVNSIEEADSKMKSFVIVVDNSEMLVDILKDGDGDADLSAVWTNGAEFSSVISHLLSAKWEISEKYVI